MSSQEAERGIRRIAPGGDRHGTHRGLLPASALPQQAWRVDSDFTRLFEGEALLAVETLNLDAASFAQMEEVAREAAVVTRAGPRGHEGHEGHDGRDGHGEHDGRDEESPSDAAIDAEVAHIVTRTVADRGKQHNPVTGSGGMLLGRILQVAPGRTDDLAPGDRIASLVSLSLTPLRLDAVRAVRRSSAQMDVDGEAVLFASGTWARLPADLPERVALAALDVAGAAPQVARLVRPGAVVVILGAGGKSGVLCAAEARRRLGPNDGAGFLVGLEASPQASDDLRALSLCDALIAADARDPVAVRRAVLAATGGREADVTFSCVNVADAEMAAILVTRDRGIVYFFAMSTSFTKAALGAEGVGKDVDLFIGNGHARGHAEHTLALVRHTPGVRALFERRYR